MIDEKKLIEDINEWNKTMEIEWTSESVISLLESAPKVNEWIPCSERLPEEEGTYLVTRPNFGKWITDTMYFCRGSFTDKYVIAWQSLPEPYNKNGEN